MIVTIPEYNLGTKVASLALTEQDFQEIKSFGYNCIYLKENYLLFYPENIKIYISDDVISKFAKCHNHDVFQIDKTGKAYLFYNSESIDNAIFVTNKCNSNCIMCPSPVSSRKIDTDVDLDLIKQSIKYVPSYAEHLTITGGEPFLAGEKLFEILEELKHYLNNTSYLFLTNGRALAYKPLYKKFKETAPKKLRIGIPIHGYNDKTHDYIVQSNGAFFQTFHGLKNLQDSNFDIELRIVVSKLNCEFIDKIANLIINEFHYATSVKFIGIEMTGNAAINKEAVWIPYHEAFARSKKAILDLINNRIDVKLYNFPLCAVDEQYHNICSKSITDYKVRYTEDCDSCRLRDACGGLFAGTLRLAKSDIQPWR